MRLRQTALLALVLAGCAGSSSGTTTPSSQNAPAAVPLAELVDPTTPGVVRLDLAALTQSPHYQTFVDLMSLSLEIWDPASNGLVQMLLRSRELVMFLGRDESGRIQPVLLMRGDFTEGEARRVLGDENDDVTEEMRDGIRIYRRDRGLVAAVGTHTLIFGRAEAAMAAVDRQLAGGNGHYPDEGAFGALIETLGITTANAGYAISLDTDMKEGLAEALDLPPAALAPFSGMGLQITLGAGLEVRGTLMSESSLEAAAFLVIANQILARVRHDADVTALGVDGLLGAIQLRRDGGNILLMLSAGDQTLRQATAHIDQRLRQQRDTAAAGSPPP